MKYEVTIQGTSEDTVYSGFTVYVADNEKTIFYWEDRDQVIVYNNRIICIKSESNRDNTKEV